LRDGFRQCVIATSSAVEPLRVKKRARILARELEAPVNHDVVRKALPVVLLLVYRLKNAPLVSLLVRRLGPRADVRLWALDEMASELADQTWGCGPGSRFAHFNALYCAQPITEGSWVVLADDDAVFVKGSLRDAIDLMARAGFSLAQPGQSLWGWWTSLFNVSRPLLVARDTNYVEQGPFVIVAPDFAAHVLPLPDSGDMGWGIEAIWFRTWEGQFRVGVIDACRVIHFSRSATAYSAETEMGSMKERLSRARISSIWQLQSTNGYWWRWQQSPPWKR
jgi:hypothetical protein